MALLREITILLVVTVALVQCRTLDAQERSQGSTRLKQDFEIDGVQYYIDSDSWLHFDDARLDCEGRNKRLVTFTSDEKYGALLQWLKAHGLQWQWYWSGGKRGANSKDWSWSTTGEKITTFFWAANRPSAEYASEDRCITFGNDSKGWDDGKCIDFFPHICEEY